MFILKSTHEAAMAHKDDALVNIVKRINAQSAIIKDLQKRLKPFEARKRGAGGRFVA